MDEIKRSAGKRFRRIAYFELTAFLLFGCGLEYFVYGSLIFTSVFDALLFLLWPATAVALLHTTFILRRDTTINPSRLIAVAAFYGGYFVYYWIIDNYIPILIHNQTAYPFILLSIAPWLCVRIWFLWLLLSDVQKLIANKADVPVIIKSDLSGN